MNYYILKLTPVNPDLHCLYHGYFEGFDHMSGNNVVMCDKLHLAKRFDSRIELSYFLSQLIIEENIYDNIHFEIIKEN